MQAVMKREAGKQRKEFIPIRILVLLLTLVLMERQRNGVSR